MANFLTDGRTALLAALKGDAAIDALVKTWREFGPGLRERLAPEPAYCPLVALYPASGEVLPRFNAANEIAQELVVRIVTDGQDAAGAEEIAALIIARIDASRSGLLDLAGDGLKDMRIVSMRWEPAPSEEGPRLLWNVTVLVAFVWIRLA